MTPKSRSVTISPVMEGQAARVRFPFFTFLLRCRLVCGLYLLPVLVDAGWGHTATTFQWICPGLGPGTILTTPHWPHLGL